MIRLRTQPLRALGQADIPPGPFEVLPSRPLTNMAECESFNGRLFSGGSLCCVEGLPGRWVCRRTAFGQPPPPAVKEEEEEGISPWILAGLAGAAVVVGALLVRRSRAPAAVPAPAPKKKMLPAAPAAAETAPEEEDPRKILEGRVGQVWDTTELQRDFAVQGFMAPFVVVNRKSDGAVGSLEFTSRPRFYFGWKAD